MAKVSDERLKEVIEWKRKTNSTWPETATKYGFRNGDLLYQTLRRRLGKDFLKVPRVKKNHQFIDLPHAPVPSLSSVAVVFCQPSQLASVLGGLK